MNQQTKNWLQMVDYDLDTAERMLETGRYVYVIFMCHLAIEKILKAVVCEETNKLPPKTHDLIRLINITEVELSEKLLDFVGIINNTAVVTRYPQDLSRLVSNYPKHVAENYFNKTREVIKCIRQDQRLRER